MRFPLFFESNIYMKCNQRVWDQRIPNEPLYDRRFLIQRPTIVYQARPANTDECNVAMCGIQTGGANIIRKTPIDYKYWCKYLSGELNQGLPVNSTHKKHKNMEKTPCPLTEKQLKRKVQRTLGIRAGLNGLTDFEPWNEGVQYNIDADSKLRRLDYYNPTDCIEPFIMEHLSQLNQTANLRMYGKLTSKMELPQWINNNTKARITEPIGFNYTSYLQTTRK